MPSKVPRLSERTRVAIGDTLAFCPPMIIKEAELNELFDRAEKALDDTEGWVGKEELRAA